MNQVILQLEGKEIILRQPEKVLWPALEITKMDYVTYLMTVAPYFIPYTQGRMAMIWRYPNGVGGGKVEERSIHGAAPEWIPTTVYNAKQRILLENTSAVIWFAANRGALEFHVPFDRYQRKDYPTELVFDLDPMETNDFGNVLSVALELKRTLDSLGLLSFAKTSGSTGLQIYVPIESKYTFGETRRITTFIAEYMLQKMPDKITLDRVVERRGKKLYFDYLQLWRGRTMVVPYTVRARPLATVSTPVTWEEVESGFEPADFTMGHMLDRIREKGDLFRPVTARDPRFLQNLDGVLSFIKTHA